jgi:hypothetical protein
MPTLIRPKNAVTVSIIANVLSVPCRALARCYVAQSKGFYATAESRDELMIYGNKVMQPERRSWTHGRGIGRLFGNGICPVIGGSLADASAFGNGLRIAAAACWKAAAAFSSALGRRSMFVGVPVWGPFISGAIGGNR